MRPNVGARAGTSKPGAPAASITRREDQYHRPEELEELQHFPCYKRVPVALACSVSRDTSP